VAIVSLLSPIIALLLVGVLFVILGLLRELLRFDSYDPAPLLAALYVIVLVTTTEKLTRQSAIELSHILHSTGLAFLLILAIEIPSSALVIIVSPQHSSQSEWLPWILLSVYSILAGLNVSYFDSSSKDLDNRVRRYSIIVLIAVNTLALIFIATVKLIT
jgi:hypothetical protein